MSVEYGARKHLFTSDEFLEMGKAHVLTCPRSELIDGEIFEMSPANEPHFLVVGRLLRALVSQTSEERSLVLAEAAVVCGPHHVLAPDIVVTTPADEWEPGKLKPQNIQLLIEVSDRSVVKDKLHKAGIYAAAGVEDFWLVDIRRRVIVVNREPNPQAARFALIAEHGAGQVISPLALPMVSIDVSQIFAAIREA